MKRQQIKSAIFYSNIESKKYLLLSIQNNIMDIDVEIRNKKMSILISSMSPIVKLFFYIGFNIIDDYDINKLTLPKAMIRQLTAKALMDDVNYVQHVAIMSNINRLNDVINDEDELCELSDEDRLFVEKYYIPISESSTLIR